MGKTKTEKQRAAAAVGFIRKTAREFKTREFPKCGECGNQREYIEVWQPQDKDHGKGTGKIGGHPILGYGWADDARAIISPFNNYSYSWTARALGSIADALGADGFGQLITQLDGWDTGEFADCNTSAYTAVLLAWLGSNLTNVEYLGQAADEFGEKDGFKLLQMAQYLAIQEHAENVRAAVHAYLQAEENKE